MHEAAYPFFGQRMSRRESDMESPVIYLVTKAIEGIRWILEKRQASRVKRSAALLDDPRGFRAFERVAIRDLPGLRVPRKYRGLTGRVVALEFSGIPRAEVENDTGLVINIPTAFLECLDRSTAR